MQASWWLGVLNRGLSPVDRGLSPVDAGDLFFAKYYRIFVDRGLSPIDAGDLFFAKYYRILGYVASKTVRPWPILSLLSNNPPTGCF